MNKARATMTKPSSYSVSTLLLAGLIFHLVYIGSVFDCYFTSPVVNGMERYTAGTGDAKRLVLIVGKASRLGMVYCVLSWCLGDGLRADLLFNMNAFKSLPNASEVTAPYLRAIAEHRGAFGISHTRVPTESRPGHVAIIGVRQFHLTHT